MMIVMNIIFNYYYSLYY